MASALRLQHAIQDIQLNDYTTIMILVAIGYDYILTFSKEIEYIWNKPWTRVSTLFVMIRCLGLCAAVFSTLFGSSFLPVPAKMYVFNTLILIIIIKVPGNIVVAALYWFASWAYWIYLMVAELVMILRVWAIYNRSRIVLGILLALYIIEVVLILVQSVIYFIKNVFQVLNTDVLWFSFCALQFNPSIWNDIAIFVQIAVGAAMCLLVTVKFITESLQMYKATKQIRLNRYMNLLVREGIVYFLVTSGSSIVTALSNAGRIPTNGWWSVFWMIIQNVPFYTLVPRLVLNLRELYARDIQGRRGSHIDTAFGLSGGSTHGAVVSAIVFAEPGQYENGEREENQGDEIQIVERV